MIITEEHTCFGCKFLEEKDSYQYAFCGWKPEKTPSQSNIRNAFDDTRYTFINPGWTRKYASTLSESCNNDKFWICDCKIVKD